MIDHHHKNIKHNLVPLCKKCHDATTYGNLIISGYIQTSSGRELQYHYVEQKKMSRKKYDSKISKDMSTTFIQTFDSIKRNGILNFQSILNNLPEFECVEFGIPDIVRSGLLKSYLVEKIRQGKHYE